VEENLRAISGLIREAHAAGARFISTPEVSNLIGENRAATMARAEDPENSVSLNGYRALAAELGVWILVGSLCVRLADEDRLANRSFLIDAAGDVRAHYDKIHMFDVSLDGGESYRESRTYRPGEEAVLVETPWGVLGMTICYDLRFPHLYRTLAQAGAEFFTIPSAFTRPTGEAHWHALHRARAIENGAFVLAAAQTGTHPGKRLTYGHSLIVDPWGRVLADGGTEPGFVVAEIDRAAVTKARRSIASLSQDRAFRVPAAVRQKAAE
jgi:predicted amidohydrolase